MKILLVIALLFLGGCVSPETSNGVVPSECAEYEGDVCGLFDCMVEQCWCKAGPDTVYDTDSAVLNEEDAMRAVTGYVSEEYNVERAVQLNNAFYNVFTKVNGDEEVFTVSYDGKILKTVCGV
ncbi:hypothetical protein ACFLQ2_00540 [archaeon]